MRNEGVRSAGHSNYGFCRSLLVLRSYSCLEDLHTKAASADNKSAYVSSIMHF